MLLPKWRAFATIVGGLCLGAVACDEAVVFENPPPEERGELFARTSRVIDDIGDDNAECFNEAGIVGSNNNLLGDLTISIRQGEKGDRGAVGFPDKEDGPLFGNETCSPLTKLWAGGYYKAAGLPETMGEWCTKYGLVEDCTSVDFRLFEGTEVDDDISKMFDLQTSYFNPHVLPVFRVTQCNNEVIERDGKKIIDPKTRAGFACVNLNFICPERVFPGIKADRQAGDKFKDLVCDDPEGDADCQRCEAVSVTMHYDIPPGGDKPIVIFGAYRGVGGDAPLMDRIDLNFSGIEQNYEVIPNVCNACHGGHAYEPADPANPTFEEINLQSQFYPINPRWAMRDIFEVEAFLLGDLTFEEVAMTEDPRNSRDFIDDVLTEFLADPDAKGVDIGELELVVKNLPGGVVESEPLRLDVSGDLSDSFKINDLITKIEPLRTNETVIEGIQEFATEEGEEIELPEFADDDEIPAGWRGNKKQENFYRIIAEHCSDSCHAALPPPLDFQSFDSFREYRETIYRSVCSDFSMPGSPEAFSLFWRRSEANGDGGIFLNKDKDGDGVPAGDPGREDKDDLKGDVEIFLEFEGNGWAPLNDLGPCEVPPLAANFTGRVEFINPLGFEIKVKKCKEELDLEDRGIGNFGILSCQAICRGAVLKSPQKTAVDNFNQPACDELEDDFGLDLDRAELNVAGID